MQRFASPYAARQAYAAGLAVVYHKRKLAQRGFAEAVSDADETFGVVVGQLEIRTGGVWRPAPPQSFALFPRGARYGIRQAAGYAGPVEIINITFRLPPERRWTGDQLHWTLPDLWWRRYLELDRDCHYDAAGQRVLPLAAVAELLDGLAGSLPGRPAAGRRAAGRESPRRPDVQMEWLETWAAADELIRRRARDGLTAAELARAVAVSPTQLRRIFQAVRGEAPKTALTRFRIDAAKQLLAAGVLSISQIAERVGYRTIQRFSAAFKAATGHAPTAFGRGPHPESPPGSVIPPAT